jgi:hypothetical protein
VAQIELARSHGTALHLDGARLLECTALWQDGGRVASLFDSVYISLYKGLGGFAGAVLAGDTQLVAEAREWRHRHGGNMFALWPVAASGLAGLRRRAPLMPRYVDHAREICAELATIDGVAVVLIPRSPHGTSPLACRRQALAAIRASGAGGEDLDMVTGSAPPTCPIVSTSRLTRRGHPGVVAGRGSGFGRRTARQCRFDRRSGHTERAIDPNLFRVIVSGETLAHMADNRVGCPRDGLIRIVNIDSPGTREWCFPRDTGSPGTGEQHAAQRGAVGSSDLSPSSHFSSILTETEIV